MEQLSDDETESGSLRERYRVDELQAVLSFFEVLRQGVDD